MKDLERTYYLGGPMTGYLDYNYPAFEAACVRLRGLGFTILSPHEIPPPTRVDMSEQEKWSWYMDRTMQLVEQSQGMILLRGWPESKGSVQELMRSIEKGNPIFLYLESPGRLVRMSKLLIDSAVDRHEQT